jgi:response regulator of citrate/malate metabolism
MQLPHRVTTLGCIALTLAFGVWCLCGSEGFFHVPQDTALRIRLDDTVIFITAHVSDLEARTRALSDGAVAYLSKPFEEAELLEAIQTTLTSNVKQEL